MNQSISSSRPASLRSLPDRHLSSRAREIALLAFLGACFLLGGGSRADLASLILLRPLSFLMIGYALMAIPKDTVRPSRMPLALLLALTGLLAAQLIPLPHWLWTQLPGRALIGGIEADIGMSFGWRPLSLAPSRTLNSLFAMGVPISAAVLAASLASNRRHMLAGALIAAGIASAVFGILQSLGPAHGALYTYRITNFGAPVGLFANRNHQAIFLASLFPLIGYMLLRILARERSRWPALLSLLLGAAIVFLPLIIATGSRAGTVLALVAILGTAALWHLADRNRPGLRKPIIARLAIPIGLIAGAGIAGLTFLNSRSLGIDRLFTAPLDTEIRFRALPELWKMAGAYFPAGSGFGSFYLAFQVIEPHELLQMRYLNQAHNDLFQVVIEGGLAALLLLLAGLSWFAWTGWQRGREFLIASRRDGDELPLAAFAWLSLAILLGGSLFDYPLRTPALMAVATILAVIVSDAAAEKAPDADAC